MPSENSGGGKPKIITSNQREDRIPLILPAARATRPEGALPKGGGPGASGSKLVQPTVTPKLNTSSVNSQATISSVNSQATMNAMSERLQAQANAYFAANPDIDPLTGVKRAAVVDRGDSGTSTSSGGTSTGSGLFTSLVDAPSPTPPKLPEIKTEVVKPPIKTAPLDTFVIDQDTIPIDLMTDLIFEDIGGQELLNIARNDTNNGQTVSYRPIKNLTSIQQQYNPNNILSLQDTSDKYFINFPIKLENHILGEGEGDGPSGAYVYIETETGDLIIEIDNLEDDQQLEVEISQSGTIYEAEV
jgi:hypothetical protein